MMRNRAERRLLHKKTKKMLGNSWPEFNDSMPHQEPYINKDKRKVREAKNG